jgi:pimeloyl-ACP methyl ester carboxylesterase
MDAVILLHGLWMTGLETGVLDMRLKRAGVDTYRFRYPTVRDGPKEAAVRLAEFIARIDAPRIHFVGHSLGGIVLMHHFSKVAPADDSRVVLLGCPVRGSGVARQAATSPLARFLLGRSLDEGGLLDGLPAAWRWSASLGVVAGTRGAFGFGQMLGHRVGPGDGTVSLHETEVDGASDRVELPVSHMEMLVNAAVAQQVSHFITHGHFEKS